MRGRAIVLAVMAMTLTLLVPLAAPAGATTLLDSYCSPSGDYCTFVVKKDGGAIVFKIRAFANYFGKAEPCVTKETRVCHSRRPHLEAHGIFVWSIRWQGNYPNQGEGEYTMAWRDEGALIGHRLHFMRG